MQVIQRSPAVSISPEGIDMKSTFHFAWIKAFRRKKDAKEAKVTAIRVGAIALTSALVIMFVAINYESTWGTARYFRTNTNDYIIIQKGSLSNVEQSYIPQEMIDDLSKLPNVRVAGENYVFKPLNGRDVLYMTYQPGEDIEPLLANGRHVAADSEITIDKDLASALGLQIGSSVHILDRDYLIVGTTAETGSFGKEMVFMDNSAITHFSGDQKAFNTLAITTNGTPLPQIFMDKWGKQFDVVTQQQFIDGIVSYWGRNVTPLIVTIVEVVTIIALLSLIVTILKQLQLQTKTDGIFRAIGATSNQMANIEALAMFMMVICGFAISIPIGLVLIWISNLTTPGFHATLIVDGPAISAGIVAVISIVAILILRRKLQKSTPMSLLRGQ